MENAGLKNKVINGTFWEFLNKIMSQGVGFVVSLVLARLLTPSDYGTVALLSIFLAIANVVADGGFGGALIQKKNADELDFNSVFYMSLGLSVLAYGALFIMAPWVAEFYHTPELKLILRVTAVTIIFGAISSIQRAELIRKMLFKYSFKISLFSTFTSAIVGVSLAYLGFGCWALVWTSVATGFVGILTQWYFIGWRPKLMFSFVRLKPLFQYGWKMTLSALLDQGFSNLYGLVIGKFYSRADLAFVNKGRKLPNLIMTNVNSTLGAVAFPALCQLQDDRNKLRESMRRMMQVSTFFIFPLMMFFGVTARRTILFLYGENWLPCVPYAQLVCFMFALWPFHTINLQGIQAMGRSDVFLKLEIIKKVWSLLVLGLCMTKGVLLWMAVHALVGGPISVCINSFPNRKLLNYSLRMQVMDVLPATLICILSALPVYLMNWLPVEDNMVLLLVLLMIQGVLLFVLYGFLSFLFRLVAVHEALNTIYAKRPNLKFIKSLLDYMENKKHDIKG